MAELGSEDIADENVLWKSKRRETEKEGEELEVRCFLHKQKSHIEMSLKSPSNPWPTP